MVRTSIAGLASLVDKSLVRQLEHPDGTVRFEMLETVREYGSEQLVTDEGGSAVQGAHAAYYQHLAEAADTHLLLPDQEPWLAQLETDAPNLRAALGWLTTNDPASALALAGALRWYWLIRGNLQESMAILERTLALNADASPAIRARALIGLGFLATIAEDTERAEPALREGHALARIADNPWDQGWALFGLGLAAGNRHAYAEGETRLQEALAIIQPLADSHPAARARVFAILSDLGYLALERGDLELATARLEETLAGSRELAFTWLTSLTLITLGRVAMSRGDLARALACYHEALTIAQEHHDRRLGADALEGVASIAHAQGQLDRAQRLRGAATKLRNAILLVPATPRDPSAATPPTGGSAIAWDDVADDVADLAGARGSSISSTDSPPSGNRPAC